jgi:outer membrane lipoprotein-sorting protein
MGFGHMGGMKLFLSAAAAALLAFSASAQPAPSAAPPSPAARILPVALNGPARDAAIAEANRALNAVRVMQGRFVQISPDGSRASGVFYLQRPGKLRFEYDPPASLLIVSDGQVVALRDTALRTTERTPLDSTPLSLILGEQINLTRDARITRVERLGGALLITARDRSGGAEGEITLRFDSSSARLASWDIIDAAGGRTRIALSEVSQPESLDRRLFRLEDMLENRPGRRG